MDFSAQQGTLREYAGFYFFVDPEMLMQMMEQMSILFDCVRRAAPQEAQLLSEILPQVSLFDYNSIAP